MNDEQNGTEVGASASSASRGAVMIAAERERQVAAEGYDATHDDQATNGSLAIAAACYAISATDITLHPEETRRHVPEMWPWADRYWKEAAPVRMLVKAGALIAAEIDRRLRANEEPQRGDLLTSPQPPSPPETER